MKSVNSKSKSIIFILSIFLVLSLFSGFVRADDICIDNTAPSAPQNFHISDSPYDADGNIVLTWAPATDEPDCSGVDHYNIYRSLSSETGFVKIGETSDLHFSDNGLENGKTYYYRITAVDKVEFNPHEGPSAKAHTTIGTPPGGNTGGNTGSSTGGYYPANSVNNSPSQPHEGGSSSPVCGNGIVEEGEECDGGTEACKIGNITGQKTCQSDCTWGNCSYICGDGICSGNENMTNCPYDCTPTVTGSVCGDGVCSPDESKYNYNTGTGCLPDCGIISGCGDGTCSGNENETNCPSDCKFSETAPTGLAVAASLFKNGSCHVCWILIIIVLTVLAYLLIKSKMKETKIVVSYLAVLGVAIVLALLKVNSCYLCWILLLALIAILIWHWIAYKNSKK